jgi:signal transduction histidine kinase
MRSGTAQDRDALDKLFMGGTFPVLAVAAGYLACVEAGFALTFAPQPLAIRWPANALLLASLLLLPPRYWWRTLLAVLAVHLLAQGRYGVPLAPSFGWFASNCSEALIGAAGLRWLLGTRPDFAELRHVAVFLFWCVGFATAASSSLDILLANMWGGSGHLSWQLWQARFLSNACATLAVVPVLAGWQSGTMAVVRAQPWTHDLEAGLVVLVLVLAGLGGAGFLVGAPASADAPLLLCMSLLALLWCAVRLDPRFTSAAYLLFALCAVAAALHERGNVTPSALGLQLFLIALGLPLLLLAAARHECQGARQALRCRDAQLDRETEARRRAVQAGRRRGLELACQRDQLAHLARVLVLGELSGAFAHELSQPLTAIRANAHAARRLLERSAPDLPLIRAIVDDILSDDQRASEVIARLRVLFMGGAAVRQPLDLNELVRQAVKLTRASLAEQGIVLTLELAPAPCPVDGDSVQLQQVLLNLIVNASEAMRSCPGGHALRVAVGYADGAAAVVTISDTGPGIDALPISRIFEPFFTTKTDGLGFGLSISRAIVVRHGGRLEAGNNPGRGSRFCIFLPMGAEMKADHGHA